MRWLLGLVLVGCGASTTDSSTLETKIEVRGADSSPAARGEHVYTTPERIRREACADRSPCVVKSVREVGDGLVVLVQLGEAQELSVPGDKPLELTGLSSQDNRDQFEMLSYGRCIEFEYVRLSGPNLGERRKLGNVCNEGHGAAGMGEDTVTIADGRFTHETSGGSAWRWGSSTTIEVATTSIVSESWSGWWTNGENEQSAEWSWQSFSGKTSWSAPSCDPNRHGPTIEGEGTLLARIEADGFDQVWKTTALGDCATRLGPDQELAAVVVGDRLYVELRDDVYPTGKAVDTLEIWYATDAPSWDDPCAEVEEPEGTTLRILDGKTAALGAAAGPLHVERSAAPVDSVALRIAIDLPPKLEALTLVYRDIDAASGVAKVTQSSELDPMSNASLGAIRTIQSDLYAHCESKGGRLDRVMTWKP